MAKLYITEFVTPGVAHGGVVPVGDTGGWKENSTSPLAIGVTSTACVALGSNTRLVRLHADATCSVSIGITAVAVTTGARMAPNQTEYYAVPGVTNTVVAVIVNT